MKVGASQQNTQILSPKDQKKVDVQKRLAEKFGEKFQMAANKPKSEDKVEISEEARVKNSTEKDFGDIKSNDPKSEDTKAKLSGLLKTGGFMFNDKEREALSEILKG